MNGVPPPGALGPAIEGLMYGLSQLFLIPVLLAIALLFLYAFHALGAFAWQALQPRRGVPAAFELLDLRRARIGYDSGDDGDDSRRAREAATFGVEAHGRRCLLFLGGHSTRQELAERTQSAASAVTGVAGKPGAQAAGAPAASADRSPRPSVNG